MDTFLISIALFMPVAFASFTGIYLGFMSMKQVKNNQREFTRSYGRIKGRKLSASNQQLLTDFMPSIKPDVSEYSCASGAEQWLEIGFGSGEHMLAQARLHPNVMITGAEPYLNGVCNALKEIKVADLKNIRIHAADVRPLIKQMPDECLSRAYILYPDPWPKKRHHERRLFNLELLQMLQRVLKPGGLLIAATDHMDYAAWMLEKVFLHGGYKWQAQTSDDYYTPPQDWVKTRYEEKLLTGCRPVYLVFKKL